MSAIEGKVERAWALMREIGTAMLVTHDGHGDHLRARPMAAHPQPDENTIYFLTDAATAKDAEIERNTNVCLAFADSRGQKFVSVTGLAEVSNDRAKIKQLWTPAAKVFWNDENDPSIRIVRVAASAAEYWDSPRKVVASVKMLVAGVTGAKADLGANEKVRLSSVR
jgi:general stress protein 26